VNLHGEVLYNTSREFFFPLQGEEKYCTEGFKELALIYGSTEESYRKTSALLKRIRHQEDGGTPCRTIRETTEHEGLRIQDHLEEKVGMIFHEHGFTPEGQPQESILGTLTPPTAIVKEESLHETLTPDIVPNQCQIDMLNACFANEDAKDAVETSVDGVVIKALNEVVSARGLCDQSRIDMLKNPVPYEDAKDAVNISVDDVGAKKPKDTREPKPHGPPSKKKRAYVHNTVMHVEHGGGFYMLNGYGVGCVLRLWLAFLWHNRLLSHRFVFFVDGHTLYCAVMAFFSWYPNMSVILDWYHLRKKCRELLSLALKGSKIRNAVLGKLMPLLWYGLVDQALDYLSTIPEAQIKNQDELIHLITYLGKNRPMIPVYAVRRELGLRNSSNRGEKANDLLVAQRQKHNGMSWSKSGSVALASVTALKKNKTYKKWFQERKLEFKLVS
jgi:hypothetical protein